MIRISSIVFQNDDVGNRMARAYYIEMWFRACYFGFRPIKSADLCKIAAKKAKWSIIILYYCIYYLWFLVHSKIFGRKFYDGKNLT